MSDTDLARLYCIETKTLNQAVKRNIKSLCSSLQKKNINLWGHNLLPQKVEVVLYVFTEQGVALLSSVLNSERVIHITGAEIAWNYI